MMEYPFFVYGTLRPLGYLAQTWEDLAGIPDSRLATARHDGRATVRGARLVAAAHGSFPYALPAPGDVSVVGCLLHPEPGREEWLASDLDALEGHPTHYVRRLVTVHTPGILHRKVQAWMYFASAEVEKRLADIPATAVPGNDWYKYDPNDALVRRLAREL